jgi:hypothetical protein
LTAPPCRIPTIPTLQCTIISVRTIRLTSSILAYNILDVNIILKRFIE